MNKIVSPWAALFAFAIICAMVTVLILKGHTDALTIAATAVGGIMLAVSRVVRGNIVAPAPIDDTPGKKPPSVPPVVGALLMVLAFIIACATSAKIQYGAMLDACVDKATTRAEADACFQTVRLEWDEAGAKPALVLDGGAQ